MALVANVWHCYPPRHVCPTCGRCPTCGSHPPYVRPWVQPRPYWWYQPSTIHPSPYYGTTTAIEQAQDVVRS
jgi:hypothetical protein